MANGGHMENLNMSKISMVGHNVGETEGGALFLSVSMQGLIDKHITEMTTKLNVGQIHVMS